MSIYLLESLARLFVELPRPLISSKILGTVSNSSFPADLQLHSSLPHPLASDRTTVPVPSRVSDPPTRLANDDSRCSINPFRYRRHDHLDVLLVFFNVKYGKSLNKDANFSSFVNSFLLLFQVLTGEGWRQFMYDLQVDEPYCSKNHGNNIDNCGFGMTLYFVTYVIAMGYIFTNLFVASILDHVTLSWNLL